MSTVTDEAFTETFTRMFPRARRVAERRLGDRVAAEDVAAEALGRTYAHWREVDHLNYLEAWILRVASNLAANVQQRSRPVMPLPAPAVEDERVATRITLTNALRRLPERQREVIVLRYLAGLSEPEVADALSIHLGTVKTHVRRGLAALRRELG
jgi:RNA polymerase sigma factor (sigma-70 family)